MKAERDRQTPGLPVRGAMVIKLTHLVVGVTKHVLSSSCNNQS